MSDSANGRRPIHLEERIRWKAFQAGTFLAKRARKDFGDAGRRTALEQGSLLRRAGNEIKTQKLVQQTL